VDGAVPQRLTTDTLLRYLAVAHFGRGAGEYRVREHPAVWRAVAERALAPQRGVLREAFASARREGNEPARRAAAARAAKPALAAAVRAALGELYPEATALLSRAAGASTGTTPGASESATGVVPR